MESGSEEVPEDPAPRERKRRRWWLWVGLTLVLLPVLLAAGLVARIWSAPLVVPERVVAEVETRLDRAMLSNAVTLGGITLDMPVGPGRPRIEFQDMRLRDPDGRLRAGFSRVSLDVEGTALLRGEIRLVNVELSGAGLRLSRDAEGRFDLALTSEDTASEVSLQETLARVDAMFTSTIFTALESVTGSGLELALADGMTGQVMRVRQAQMQLDRKGPALTLIVGGALEGTRDASLDIAITRNSELALTNIGMNFENLSARDVATVTPALAWLDLMRAPISGFLGGLLNDDGSVGDLRAAFDIGEGAVHIEGARDLPFNAIGAAMRYEAADERLHFEELALDAPDLSFQAAGHADVSPDGTVFVGQFRLSDILADPEDLFEAPVPFEGGVLDMRLTLGRDVFLEVGQATLFDGTIEARANGFVRARAEGLDVSIDAHLTEGAASDILSYWPPSAASRARMWIAENLSEANLSGVDFALRSAAGDPVESALSFDFDQTRIRALRSLPEIEEAAGYFSLVGPRLILRLDEGRVPAPDGGPVSLAGSTMFIEDVRPPGPDATFDLAVTGQLTDVLRLLNEPPVSIFRNGDLSPDRVGQGRAVLSGVIETRLMRREEGTEPVIPDFRVTGSVSGYSSTTLIPDRRLAADRLQVEVTNDSVQISGRASFDGVPLTGQWSRALGPGVDATSRIEGRADLSRETLAGLGVDLPSWLISGRSEAQISLTLPPGGTPRLSVRSDLRGVSLSVPALGWGLGRDQTGELVADMRLGSNPEVTLLSLDAPGIDLSSRVTLRDGGGLQRLTADRLRVGGWLDVNGALVGRGQGVAPSIEVSGGTVDLRNLPQGGGGSGQGGGPISASIDRLQISEGIALTGVTAELTTNGGLSGQVRGLVNGAAPIAATLVTSDNRLGVRVRANDGGAVLRAAGVFDSAFGGEMELILQATGAEGTYDGTLSIDSPRLRNAPAMAELLNLISVVGLLEQLGGEGINLGDVDARFRLTPTQVILAEGPSMGISLDGTYALQSRTLDMQGVVSPLYMVNGLIGAIFAPRREGLFGFAYRLTGTAQNPQVNVNPLSILTPGIFREIFRRPPPELSEGP